MTLPPHNLLAAALQAGLVALVAAPLPRLFGIASPRARLAYWRGVMLLCVLLPLLAPRVEIPAPLGPVRLTGETLAVTGAGGPIPGETAPVPADGWRRWLPAVSLAQLVGAGILVRAAWLALGLLALSRLRASARRLWPRSPAIDEAVAAAGADAEFLVSHRALRPMTFGVLRPVVLVPADFPEFTHEQQKAIACHELLHVRRLDWIRTTLDEAIRTLAWFHPAAWWLTGQVHLSREQLVDQEVVRRVGSRRPYLDALLHLASSERRGGLLPATLFLGRAHLPQRIALLVKEVRMSTPRLVSSFVAMAAVLALCGQAAVSAFPLRAEATVGQSVPQAARPGVPAGVPPGQVRPAAPARSFPTRVHDVRPEFPANAPVEGAWPWLFEFTLDAQGTVTEVRSLSSATNPLTEAVVEAVRQWRYSPPPRAPFTMQVGFNLAAGRNDPAGQPPVLVGGNVKAPAKVKDVRPVYPQEAQDARVQGVVILEARIDSDGAVSEARVVRSIPMLDRAALEAVLQWRYASPGFPLQMVVTCNFTLSGAPSKEVQGGVGGGVSGAGERAKALEEEVAKARAEAGSTSFNDSGYLRVGGNVTPPVKVKDVRPVYPEAAIQANAQGVVIVEAKIGRDGRVEDARILRSIPLFDQAALDAVRQWEYKPTLLNGVPVPVIMTLTVSFMR